jgi:hypothetical protein
MRRKREHLLAQVRARVERFAADPDPVTVLHPQAVAEVTALLETVPDPVADLAIAHCAGWLHWSRHLALDSDEDQRELAAALALFEPVYRANPRRSPGADPQPFRR